MKFYIILFCICMLLFNACNISKYTFKNDKIELSLEVRKIEQIEKVKYKLNGVVKIKNLTGDTVLIDLKNIILDTGNNIEYEVYIDTIASRLIQTVSLEAHKTYCEKVYWIINSKKQIKLEGVKYLVE